MTAPDLGAAAAAIETAQEVVDGGVRHLAGSGGPDAHQVLAYDLAHAAAAVATARSMLDYGAKGDDEARLTCAFVADAVHDLAGRLIGREAVWGLDGAPLGDALAFLGRYRDPTFLADLAAVAGPRHLPADFELVQDTFRAFAEKEIGPAAEHVHRDNGDVPEDILSGLAEMGAFGLSVPAEYGGFAEGGDSEYLAMVVATEELSRGIARHRRIPHHPAGDPDPRPGQGRDGGAEARVAAEAGDRRGDGRGGGHGAGLRL